MKDRQKVRVISPRLLLTYLMVVTFVLTGVSFARFGTTKSAEDAANAATFTVTATGAGTVTQSVYLKDDNESQQYGFLTFTVTSTSEVPVTYDVTLTAPSGGELVNGVEWYLTPVNKTSTSSSDYNTILATAKAAKKTGGTHTHRPNGATTVTFTGCGIAPAGTYTQEYMLNLHHESGDYWVSGIENQLIKGIKITATARDGRNNSTPNHSISVEPAYTTPYTKG